MDCFPLESKCFNILKDPSFITVEPGVRTLNKDNKLCVQNTKSTECLGIIVCLLTKPNESYKIDLEARLSDKASGNISVKKCANEERLESRDLRSGENRLKFSFKAVSRRTLLCVRIKGHDTAKAVLNICRLVVCRDFPSSICLRDKCTKVIRQIDIDKGGTTGFIIKDPGVYCLGEDVCFKCIGIQIQASCVTLDLQDHCMDGKEKGRTGILIKNQRNVTVKNGRITNSFKAQELAISDAGINIENSESINLDSLTCDNIGGDAGFRIDRSRNISIENCMASNCAQQGFQVSSQNADSEVQSRYITFRKCTAFHNNQVTIGDQTPAGGFLTNNGQFVHYDTCSAAENFIGFFMFTADKLTFDDCCAEQNKVAGFLFDTVTNSHVEDCLALENAFTPLEGGGRGFTLSRSTGISLKRCKAISNALDGFFIGAQDISSSECSFLECLADHNGVDGFVIQGESNLVSGCTAIANSTNFNNENAAATNHFINNVSQQPVVTDYNNVVNTSTVNNTLSFWFNIFF